MSYPVLAKADTWYRGDTSKASIKQIDIKMSYTPTTTVKEQWNADALDNGSIKCYIEGDKLTIAGDGSEYIKLDHYAIGTFRNFSSTTSIIGADKLDVSDTVMMGSMFYNCAALTTLDVSNWDVSSVYSMSSMFRNCASLTTLDVSEWNVGNVTRMNNMFNGCISLQTLDVSEWNVGNVINMERMFSNCDSLTTLDVSEWNVGNITNMKSMFATSSHDFKLHPDGLGVTSLNVSKWDTKNVTDMSYMSWGVHRLAELDVSNWDVSKVTTFDHMFAHARIKLIGDNVKNWRTDSATNMNALFHTVENEILDVSNFITGKVTSFSQMFQNCFYLKQIIGLENFDTSQSIDFSEMFRNCPLKELNLGSFDTTKAKDGAPTSSNGGLSTTMEYFIDGCIKLEKLTLGEKVSFDGDGTTTVEQNRLIIPIPNVIGNDGKYHTADGVAYAPNEIPSRTFGVYYTIPSEEYKEKYIVKHGTVSKIADAIRGKAGTNEEMSLADIESGVIDVFNEGYDKGIERGKLDEYNSFWDIFQQNGERTSYGMAFAEGASGIRWIYGSTYRPKYPIAPTEASQMYYSSRLQYDALKDVSFSNCKDFYQTFAYSTIKKLGVIDMRAATRTTQAFANCKQLHTIDVLVVSENTPYSNTFLDVINLENLIISGTIGQNGFNLQSSTKLTRSSLASVISALSLTTIGLTVTVSNVAVQNAFTEDEWSELIAPYSNWNIVRA